MTILSKVKIWSSFLLIILIAGMLCACGSPAAEVPSSSDTSSPPAETIEEVPVTSDAADKVEVVYFHRTQRCNSCIYAETGVRYTVGTYFADELASGKLVLKAVDLGDKENAAIVKKYGAYTSSLFINTVSSGTDHIEEVTDIWLVMGDNEAFVEVVRSKIEESLKEIS